MTEQTEKVYQFASLTKYSRKQRLLIRLADLAFYMLIRVIGGTVRFRTEGSEHLDTIAADGRTPIYVAWHDRVFLGAYALQHRGIVFLTSQSFDGEYIARFLQRLGIGTVRGSSTRGGARALVEMIRLQKKGLPMGFTADGPKGPRHIAKPGPVMLAKKSGDPILAFAVTPKRFFTIGSWDRLIIPFPFTSAVLKFAEPIYVADYEIEAKLAELQASLDGLDRIF